MDLEEIIQALDEMGIDTSVGIEFRFDGLALGVGAIKEIDENTVHIILEED